MIKYIKDQIDSYKLGKLVKTYIKEIPVKNISINDSTLKDKILFNCNITYSNSSFNKPLDISNNVSFYGGFVINQCSFN